MRNIHRGFSHPLGGVSPVKQEDNFPDPNRSVKVQVEEKEEKEKTTKKKKEVKEKKVVHTGPPPQDNSKQGVIKQGKAPAWYKNLFQSDDKGREPSDKKKKEEKYALPSTPTWGKFENSKVGKAIDAKGIVKEKNNLMRLLGYGKGEEKDLAMDATAVVFPAADLVHATTKAAEGKYIDAGLYALFAAVPGAAGPLVNKAKQLIGMGDKVGAEKLLKETIEKNKKAINTNLKPKGGVDGGLSNDAIKKNKANVDRYGQPEPTLYGKPKTQLEFNKVVHESTEGIGAMGRNMDNAGVTIKNLDPEKSIKKIGVSDSGQEIYEITYPSGEKLKFWESTGSANKAVELSKKNAHLNAKNSKGFFGVFPGNMDGSNVGFSKDWYIKSEGWERGYGSEIVEDTGIWLKSLKESGILK